MHWMGHSLNLVQDTRRSIKIMKDAFNTVLELSKIFKYSAKKKVMLMKLKSELSPQTPGIQYVLNHFDLFYSIMKLLRQVNNIDRKGP